jgi:hypothetical protein
VGSQTPVLRHGEVLVAASDTVQGWRNLGHGEAVLFWIVFAGSPRIHRPSGAQNGT